MAREGKVFNEDSASTSKSPEDQKESEKTQKRKYFIKSCVSIRVLIKGSVGAGLKFGQDILKFDNGWLCHLTED